MASIPAPWGSMTKNTHMNPALADLVRLIAEAVVEALVAEYEDEQGRDRDDKAEEEAA